MAAPAVWEELVTPALQMQIDLVGGGRIRLRSSTIEKWRSFNQKTKWIKDDLATAAQFTSFNHRLKEEWDNKHGIMRESCDGQPEDVCRRRGLEVLDWSHDDAPLRVIPPNPYWRESFLVRGSYQELAENLDVGWHPRFDTLIPAALREKSEKK